MTKKLQWTVLSVTAGALFLSSVAFSASKGELRLLKGQEEIAQQQFERAAQTLLKLNKDEKTGALAERALVLAARAQHLAGDDVKASETLGRFLKKYPSSKWQFRAKHLLADVYCALKRYDKASQITRAHLEFVASEDTRMKLARLYLDLGDEAYEGKFVETAPGQKTRRRDINRALEFYGKALALDLPEKVSLQMCLRLSDCHARLSQYQRAASSLEPLLKSKAHTKDWPEARRRQGEALLKAGQRVEAREAFRALLELGEAHAALAMERLGDSYSPLSNDSKEAVALGLSHWRKALKQYPKAENAEGLHWKLAEALFRKGQHEDAVAEYRAFLQLCKDDDKSGVARVRIAESYERRKLFEQARRSYGSFLGRHPSHRLFAQVQERIALSWLEQGEEWASKKDTAGSAEKAVAVWQEFLKRYPVHPKAGPLTLRIGDLWSQREAWDKSLAAYERVVQTARSSGLRAQAQFQIAEIWHRKKSNLQKAIVAYAKVKKSYRYTSWGYRATDILRVMRETFLKIGSKRSFRSREKPTLAVQTRNIESLTFKAYKIDLVEYFDKERKIGSVQDLAVALVKPDRTWTVKTAKYEAFRLLKNTVEMPFEGEGAWVVTAENEGFVATTMVLVTDITTIVKRSRRDLLVFAQDRLTGRPAPGVTVMGGARSSEVEEIGKTGEDGVLHLPMKSKRMSILAVRGGSVAFSETYMPWISSFGYSPKAYIYTDRSVYRPGHEVQIKAIVRLVKDGQYVVPSGETMTLGIVDAAGLVMTERRVRTSANGTLATSLQLDTEAPVGTYTVQLKRKSQIFRGTFKVEEYKKPETLVEVRTERADVLTGESVKVTIESRSYYGDTIPNAELQYTVRRLNQPFDASVHKANAWFFKPDQRRKRDSGQQILSRSGSTNDKGQLSFEFKTRALDVDSVYVISVYMRGPDRRWVSGSGQVFCTRRSYYALLDAEKKVVRPKESFRVQLKTVNAAHQGVASRGQVRVLRLSGIAGTDNEAVLQVLPIETKASGEGSVELSLPKPGEYRLRFVGKDRRGTEVEGSVLVSASGDAEDLAKQAKIRADREVYKEGETARVLINSPEAKSLALLTFEGEKVLRYRVLELSKRSTVFKIQMEDRYSPNIFMNLAIATESGLYQSQDEVMVFKYLNVEVKTDRETYGPGDEVEVTVITKDQGGGPVAAELSLAVVDEKVFSLAPDTMKAMKPFFYDQRRKHGVHCTSSVTWKYRGVTRAQVKELIEDRKLIEREKNEKDFKKRLVDANKNMRRALESLKKDEAPADGFGGRPGAGGKGMPEPTPVPKPAMEPEAEPMPSESKAAPKMPKSKRRGRGRAGELLDKAEQSFRAAPTAARKRFADTAFWRHNVETGKDGRAVLRFKLPSDLTRWRLTARGVTEQTLVGQKVTGIVTTKKVVASSMLPRFLTTKDKAMMRVGAHNRSGKDLKGRFQLRAKGLAVSKEESAEALKLLKSGLRRYEDLWVQARKAGPSSVLTRFETELESDALVEALTIQAFGKPYTAGDSGELTDKVVVDLELPKNTWAGSQQLEVRLRPSLRESIMMALESLDQSPYNSVEQTVNRFLPWVASYSALRKMGVPNDALRRDIIERVQRGVQKILHMRNGDAAWGWFKSDTSSPSLTAYALFSLEVAAQMRIYVDSNALWQSRRAAQRLLRQSANGNERALLLYALSRSGQAKVDDLNRAHRQRNSLSPQGLALLALAWRGQNYAQKAKDCVTQLKGLARRQEGECSWSPGRRRGWFDSQVEATAWCGLALALLEPDSKMLQEARRYLQRLQLNGTWRSTRETASVLMFLGHLAAKMEVQRVDGEVDVEVNGKSVAETKLDLKTLQEGGHTLRIGREALKDGKNRIVLTKKGEGRVRFSVRLKAIVKADKMAGSEGVVQVRRRYRRAVFGQQSELEGWSIVRPSARPKPDQRSLTEVVSGQRLWVELDVSSREALPFVVVEDSLPAGCEVVAGRESGPISRFEARDDGVALFLSRLPKGVTRLRYQVQVVTPGQFGVMPCQVQSVYEPELNGHSASADMTILDDASKLKKATQWTPDERFEEAVKAFEDDKWETAKTLFLKLRGDYELRAEIEQRVLTMTLTCALKLRDATLTVDSYEALKNLNPRAAQRLGLKVQMSLVVAYDIVGEALRSHTMGRTVLQACFRKEAQLAEDYRRLNRDLKAQQYMESLLLSYPENDSMRQEWLQLAERFFEIFDPDHKGLRVPMIAAAYKQLKDFCALFPKSSLCVRAQLRCADALKRMEDFEGADREAGFVLALTKDSHIREQALMMQLRIRYDQKQYQKALEAGNGLLNLRHKDRWGRVTETKYKSEVQYLFAKIYHVRGELVKALDYYKSCRHHFDDAKDAYNYFMSKGLEIPKLVEVKPGEASTLDIRSKNVESFAMKVYAVDFMTLFLTRKSLKGIHRVKLTGIKPVLEKSFPLSKDKAYAWNEDKLALPMTKTGVYLVVGKSKGFDRSSLVLVSDLKIKVQKARGRLRVYATFKGKPAEGVRVKISNGSRLVASGKTDARGVFDAPASYGTISVVAKKGQHYALK